MWDDNGDTAHRPNSITVRLARKYTDADGGQHEVAFREGEVPGVGADGRLTITSADASAWTNTWRKVVTGLPAAFDDNGTVRYYSYSVTEVALDGGGKELADYSTTVTPGEDGSFSIVITNRLPLPATGGIDIHRLIILGVLTRTGGEPDGTGPPDDKDFRPPWTGRRAGERLWPHGQNQPR